jgi:lysophospholipase L1-like esterase
MTMKSEYERRISLLARSSFPICLLILASGFAVFPVVLLHQSSVPAFWRWSVHWLALIGAYTVALVGLIFLCRWLLSCGVNALQASVANWLRSPYDHAIWAVVLVGSIPALSLSIHILGSSASNAVRALVGLALFWLFLLWVLMVSLYWPLVRRILQIAQPWFLGIGVAMVAILCAEGYLRVYDLAFNRADTTVERSTGDKFLGEENVSWQSAYWEEFAASAAMQWTPYLYWRRVPFEGEFINVDERGIRRTLSSPHPVDMKIFFFGGSTAWGTGARDTHTIPSEMVALLADRGIGVEMTNFGESNYISRQDAILFECQLQQGNVPDIAIFYWGGNDVYSVWQQGYIGLAGNESNRVAEFQFGRRAQWDLPPGAAFISLLYDTAVGSRLLSWFGIPDVQLSTPSIDTSDLGRLEDANLVLTTYPHRRPEDVAEYFVSIMTHVEHLAQLYDVEVLFVWQPLPFKKEPLCSHEDGYLEKFLSTRQGLAAMYRTADTAIRDRTRGLGHNWLIISDLFMGHEECVFIDNLHTTEAGNRTIARHIAQRLFKDMDFGQETLNQVRAQAWERRKRGIGMKVAPPQTRP